MDRSRVTAILGAAVLLAVGVVVFVLMQHRGSPAASALPALNAEQKSYLSQITFSGARMSAAENFAGSTLTYLDAQLTNRGSREVRRVDLQLEFHDTLNQVVLRETAHPVTPRTPPLIPGESRGFQVTFEHMPADWNQAPPSITATGVEF